MATTKLDFSRKSKYFLCLPRYEQWPTDQMAASWISFFVKIHISLLCCLTLTLHTWMLKLFMLGFSMFLQISLFLPYNHIHHINLLYRHVMIWLFHTYLKKVKDMLWKMWNTCLRISQFPVEGTHIWAPMKWLLVGFFMKYQIFTMSHKYCLPSCFLCLSLDFPSLSHDIYMNILCLGVVRL